LIDSTCWICGSENVSLVRTANLPGPVTPESFAITDSHYGTTGSLYRCGHCGFVQCPDFDDLAGLYGALEDPEYEVGRVVRSAQMRAMLRFASRYRAEGRLLDIGAGSGMLVEQALRMGYDAAGLEPSRYLQSIAEERRLPVRLGTFPDACSDDKYDVITLVDVLEHVGEPMRVLSSIGERLLPGGIVAIATPDVSSVVARALRYRWWHYRVAHVGYFSKRTLCAATSQVGLRAIAFVRPPWYFSVGYLLQRARQYLPGEIRLRLPAAVERLPVRINFGDSLLGVFSKQGE
jgi:SAM-dependent methyltransferase